jgi:hypothetical protein
MAERTTWHGQPALVYAGGGLTATVLPERGGKIAALVDGAGRDWLVTGPDPLPPRPAYGASFIEAEMCGWDEMVPTIDACTVDGVPLPDHGEAWRAAWQETGDALVYAGERWPYRISRTITHLAGGLRLGYRLAATADRPVPVLWAAHPQFPAPPGTRIVLPAQVREVLDIQLRPAAPMPWDEATATLDSLAFGDSRKVYVHRDRPVGWAAVRWPDGSWLRLRWDPERVPYLGLWFDNRRYAAEPVVALEPSNAWYDALDRAVGHGTAPLLHPDQPLDWTLDVTTGSGPLE